jgi:2-phosphosulfolactate phosphatase
MPPLLHVYALPEYVTEEEFEGGVAVVIDVLRASTTIVHALEAGAREIVPCLEVEEALERAAGLAGEDRALGGERGGLRIDGFDLGNSPSEYTPEAVGGRTVYFTTTNGTRALHRARRARRVLVGAFVNASAVLATLAQEEQIHLLCSGSAGQITRDDVLLAGLLVRRLQHAGGADRRANAQAITARENWTASFAVPYAIGAEPLPREMLAAELRKGVAGKRLVSLGLEEDILSASEIDRFEGVPRYHPREGRIRLA